MRAFTVLDSSVVALNPMFVLMHLRLKSRCRISTNWIWQDQNQICYHIQFIDLLFEFVVK